MEVILGFDKIRNILAGMASSVPGRNTIYDMEEETNILIIKSDLDLIDEMKKIITATSFPIHGLEDVENELDGLVSENQLMEGEIVYKVGKTIKAGRTVYEFSEFKKQIYPDIHEICRDISVFPDLERVIFRSIDSTGYVLDTASGELKNIRNRITVIGNRIKAKVRTTLDAYKHAGYSRDEEITIRNGRYVIPVKSENRNKVKGIVHDESATGGTLFVEPIESVEMNYELNKLRTEEKKEIIRILKAIANEIFAVKNEILETIEILTELDVIYAKAKFAVKYNCNKVHVNEKNITNIHDGYHPLLVEKHGLENVMPLSVEIGEKFHTLIITGPNAGGKTVALKTIGLFSYMIKMGMQIPAEGHSNIAIYNNIFVDIGDNQSIENDLSTFSSNITILSKILKSHDNKTLVLLDEIGASTDPQEGSALSMSVLKELTKRKFSTIATTHQGVLKAFAYKTKGIENGSMEFDRKTISPTYRFRISIPGSSYAFEIAKRYGLPKYILNNAKQYLGSEKQELENLISDLDEKITKYNTYLRSAKTSKNSLNDLKEHYHNKFEELKKKEKAILKEAAKRGEAIITASNRLIENAIAEIKSVKADKKAVKQIRTKLAEEKNKMIKKHNVNEQEKPVYTGELEVGLEVQIKGFSGWGVVEEINGKNVIVAMGDMNISVKKNRIIDSRQKKQVANVSVQFNYSEPENFNGLRLDLRGMRGDDAISKLEEHINQMKLHNLTVVEIVHGKGNGILDKLVNSYLEKCPLVKSRKYGEYGEGDYGVTIAEIF